MKIYDFIEPEISAYNIFSVKFYQKLKIIDDFIKLNMRKILIRTEEAKRKRIDEKDEKFEIGSLNFDKSFCFGDNFLPQIFPNIQILEKRLTSKHKGVSIYVESLNLFIQG